VVLMLRCNINFAALHHNGCMAAKASISTLRLPTFQSGWRTAQTLQKGGEEMFLGRTIAVFSRPAGVAGGLLIP
jgi:hypothetical protein